MSDTPETVEYKGRVVPRMPTCTFIVKEGRLEAECDSIEASHDLAELLQHEVIIRVKPAGAVQEESSMETPLPGGESVAGVTES